MPRKVRNILAKMGLPDSKVSTDRASGMINRYVAENLNSGKSKPTHNFNEDMVVELIDDKRMLGEIIEEFLPVFKKIRGMKNPDDQMQALARFAPLVFGRALLFGDPNESRQAAKDILDRVQGKPIERQMTMQVNVNSMTETEVDHELNRLLGKFNPSASKNDDGRGEAVPVEFTQEEGTGLGGDESRQVDPEQSAETVPGVESQN